HSQLRDHRRSPGRAVSRFYLDTSAAAKLLVEEAESTSLAAWADGAELNLVATHLLETELRRFASRHDLPQVDVSAILARVDLHTLPPSIYREAGLLPGPALRSLDALHLAASIRLDVEALVTYDVRLAGAAEGLGLQVHAPGSCVSMWDSQVRSRVGGSCVRSRGCDRGGRCRCRATLRPTPQRPRLTP